LSSFSVFLFWGDSVIASRFLFTSVFRQLHTADIGRLDSSRQPDKTTIGPSDGADDSLARSDTAQVAKQIL
jgi:hypothetical protein